MYYDQYGNKNNPTIVFLHGAGTVDTFSNQYCLQNRFHIVVPHIYGSGKEVTEKYELNKTLDGILKVIESLNKDKVSVVGCSLGAGLAVALVSGHQKSFDKAVFLSGLVCPTEKSINRYVKISNISYFTLKWGWALRLQGKYWHFTEKQIHDLAESSKLVTKENYKAWFTDGVKLKDCPNYKNVKISLLAICGKKEVKEIKDSLLELGKQNPECKTEVWEKANHNLPMRCADKLNKRLIEFLIPDDLGKGSIPSSGHR